jgi:aspartate racemase
MTELVNGAILDDTRAGLLRIVNRLKREQKIQGLVLGGTELPLILKDGDDPQVPFLDTTSIHVQSIVKELL